MATLFDARITQVASAQDNITGVCVDPTYAWFVHSGNGGYLSRVRQTDGVMVKADGTDGDYTNARISTTIPGGTAIATDNTYVGFITPVTQSAYFYLNTDVSSVTSPTLPSWGDGRQAIYSDGYFWFPIYGYSVRITPGTWAVNSTATGIGNFGTCADGNGYIYLCGNTQYIKKIRASDNTVVATIDMGAGTFIYNLASDGTYLYVLSWNNPTTYVWKMRISDEYVWKTDFSGFTATKSQGQFQPPTWEGLYGYQRVFYSAGYLYLANQFRGIVMRYATDVMSQAGWINTAPAGRIPTGATGASPMAFAFDGTRIWSSNGLATPSYVTSFESTPPAPTLLDVSPGTGPTIDLTFDLPVNVGSPTIGPTVEDLTVNGAAQNGEDGLTLDVSFPPQAPTEVLTGSAQACNAFAAPTGGTATDVGDGGGGGGGV